MTGALPPAARRVLDEGVTCYLAVRTPSGPHLTPVVYALDGGRLWLTTARSSVKARAWRADPSVAGLISTDDMAVSFRGEVRTFDALDPVSWPAAAVAGPRLVRAAARFSLKNARFFAGYAVDARRVPLAWAPPGRVFGEVRITSGILVSCPDGSVVERWGGWLEAGAVTIPRSTRRDPATPGRGITPEVPNRALDLRVPLAVRRALGSTGKGAFVLQDDRTLTVLSAGWRRVARERAYRVTVPGGGLSLPRARRVISGLALDHASAWRAADMKGMLVRGTAERLGQTPPERSSRRPSARHSVELRLRPDSIVWWQGWASGTVSGT